MNLNKEMFALLKEIPTGNFADNNPKGGVIAHPIFALNPMLHAVGRALTVECYPGDNLALYQGIEAAVAGDFLIFDCKGYTGAGHFGDMMANACKSKGITGVMVNGTTRDHKDILDLEFPLYTRGYDPAPTSKDHLGSVGCDLMINNVAVHTGDLIVADGDGIVVIPENEAEQVIKKAIAKHEKEIAILKDIASGRSILDIYHFSERIRELKDSE